MPAMKSPTTPKTIYTKSAADIAKETKRRLARARAIRDRIVAVKGPRTLANTLAPFDELMTHVMEVAFQGELAFNAHPVAAVRDAADKAYQAAKSLDTELSLDRGLFEAFAKLDVSKKDEATKFAVFKVLRNFRRAGVDRDEATRATIKALNDEITAIGTEFDKAIRDDVRSIKVRKEELEGLPEDFIASRPAGADGLITITTNYPDSLPVLQYAKDASVRKRLLFEFRNRGHPANVAVLDKLIGKRHELARLLGYANYADYVTEDKMIGSGKAAAAFVDKITAAADKRAREDYERFVHRKWKDAPGALALDPWDRGYYEERVRAEQHAYDSREVRVYFPFPRVRDGLFTITGKLFGVRYRPARGAKAWHPSVEAYDVYDRQKRIGRFYLDLFPREGKFNHAAAFAITLGLKGRQLPQAALLCNFPDPSKEPALMTHDDVVTFFHEFGHLIHFIFSGGSRWAKNTVHDIEWDFIEAPSQMLEEWTRDPASLRTFARHHETGEPIPEALVRRMEKADAVGRGLDVRRQMFLAAFSLSCYNRDPKGLDVDRLARETNGKYDLIPWFDGTHLQCGFGHLNGYSAVYYTYMWSLVIAKDLFRAFQDAGPILNPRLAAKYRREILNPGSERPAAEMVRRYLGRDFGFDAYREWLEQTAG